MKQSLGRKFTLTELIKFTLPTIVMMVFMSLYQMVDGAFVARFVDTNALSAINIVYPAINLVIAIGVMLATGGSAIIAKKMGEGNPEEARDNFSFITFVGIVVGLIIMLGCYFNLDGILHILGASEILLPYAHDYAFAYLWFVPMLILQLLFQYFFVTTGKPNLGLVLTIIGGITNIVLDYIFVVTLNLGITGAAVASGIGISIPAIYGLLYFFINKNQLLYFTKFHYKFHVLLDTCTNGSSEMISNVSVAVVTLLFNLIMMKLIGEDGVAAITILLYSQFVLVAIFMGFSMGVAPIISYNYGAMDTKQLHQLFKHCMKIIITTSVLAFILCIVFAPNMTMLFTPKDSPVYEIALNGFKLFSISFLFSGINIFASALFTAYSNGKVSAILAFLRTFVFIVIGVLTLPFILGVNGAWLAMVFAELLALLTSLYYLFKYKNEYYF